MTPTEEFIQIQRALLEHAREQTKLLEQIADQTKPIKGLGAKVEFLGWMIMIAVLIVLGVSAYHR